MTIGITKYKSSLFVAVFLVLIAAFVATAIHHSERAYNDARTALHTVDELGMMRHLSQKVRADVFVYQTPIMVDLGPTIASLSRLVTKYEPPQSRLFSSVMVWVRNYTIETDAMSARWCNTTVLSTARLTVTPLEASHGSTAGGSHQGKESRTPTCILVSDEYLGASMSGSQDILIPLKDCFVGFLCTALDTQSQRDATGIPADRYYDKTTLLMQGGKGGSELHQKAKVQFRDTAMELSKQARWNDLRVLWVDDERMVRLCALRLLLDMFGFVDKEAKAIKATFKQSEWRILPEAGLPFVILGEPDDLDVERIRQVAENLEEEGGPVVIVEE